MAAEAPDRFESQDLMLHERVRRAFLDIAEEEPDRCVVIDASQPEAMVAEDVWEVVTQAPEPMSRSRLSVTRRAPPSPIASKASPRPARSIACSAMTRRSRSSGTRSASGRMHHAWLLVGPEGIGKATLAYRVRPGRAGAERATGR